MPVHPTAQIDPIARIHPSAEISAFVVIEGPVEISAGCHLESFSVVKGHTTLGANTRLHSHAVVGDVPQDRAFANQITYTHIGADCIIREGVTVHRGTPAGSATIVGNRCMLMSNSHVGHNCELEDDVTLVSGSLLGGHVHIGARTIVSGNAAIHQFVRVGELAMIGGLSKVVQDVPPYFMTDQAGHCVGVNTIGLRRAGFTPAERSEIKEAYRILYRSDLSTRAAMKLLQDNLFSEPAKTILDFVSQSTNRGTARGSVRKRIAA